MSHQKNSAHFRETGCKHCMGMLGGKERHVGESTFLYSTQMFDTGQFFRPLGSNSDVVRHQKKNRVIVSAWSLSDLSFQSLLRWQLSQVCHSFQNLDILWPSWKGIGERKKPDTSLPFTHTHTIVQCQDLHAAHVSFLEKKLPQRARGKQLHGINTDKRNQMSPCTCPCWSGYSVRRLCLIWIEIKFRLKYVRGREYAKRYGAGKKKI